jgi:ABC-type hemin transport system ATPase subunit
MNHCGKSPRSELQRSAVVRMSVTLSPQGSTNTVVRVGAYPWQQGKAAEVRRTAEIMLGNVAANPPRYIEIAFC